jgi:carboxypeptidase Taq
MFLPWLEKIIDLKRREAAYVGYPTGNPYDALLDTYEPGETSANVASVFASLRPRLVELLGRIVASPKKAPVDLLSRRFPIEQQQQFARSASQAIGFDLNAGRIDVSVHPFCSGIAPGDTRMTTRYNERHFNDAFFGVLHETGHALYEQGLPKDELFGQPLADAVSLGIHESQSRMWENLVGRSEPFWRHLFPKAKATFAEALRDVSLEQWLFAINDVRPSFIRVEADELTYNLHIMLRFELEQALISGDIAAKDVAGEWNARFKSYFGLDVPNDAQGCLQDVHWSAGLFGYFATYALGNLYAAQFFEQARQELGDLPGQFSRGEFAPLLSWLREKIHRHGRRYRAGELVRRVTGRPLDAEPLLRHLSDKAKAYYGV